MMPELMSIDAQPLQAGNNKALLPAHSTHWYEYEAGGSTHEGERIRLDFRFWNGRAGDFMWACNFGLYRAHDILNWPLGDPCPAPLGAGSETGQAGFAFDNSDAPVGGKIWKGELERGLKVYIRVYNQSDLLFEYDLVAIIEDASLS